MRPQTIRGFVLIVAAGFVLSLQRVPVQAQSLFNNRAATTASRAVPNATGGGFIPGNSGFSPSVGTGTGGSFFRPSNQRLVGGAAGQSADEQRRPASRRIEPARRTVPAGETTSQSESRRSEPGVGRRQFTPIVPRHRIAFDFAARKSTAIEDQLRLQMANLAARDPTFSQIRVLVDSAGRVSLQGQVPSENTRKLAELMVRLEPGVRAVHNELLVQSDRD